jgi:hypothetical protein
VASWSRQRLVSLIVARLHRWTFRSSDEVLAYDDADLRDGTVRPAVSSFTRENSSNGHGQENVHAGTRTQESGQICNRERTGVEGVVALRDLDRVKVDGPCANGWWLSVHDIANDEPANFARVGLRLSVSLMAHTVSRLDGRGWKPTQTDPTGRTLVPCAEESSRSIRLAGMLHGHRKADWSADGTRNAVAGPAALLFPLVIKGSIQTALLAVTLAMSLSACSQYSGAESATPADGSTTPSRPPPLLLAHYMTGYYTPEFHGAWSPYWTLDYSKWDTTLEAIPATCNPDRVVDRAIGRRELCSHFYPLTGPYDESDPDILEYQALLMKLAGIDGVIANWWGTRQVADWGIMNDITEKMFETCRRFGLRFAVNYEDRTLSILTARGVIEHSEAQAQARDDILYAANHWMLDAAYVRTNQRPVFTLFGPQYFTQGQDWIPVFQAVKPHLMFLTVRPLDCADGRFYWLPVGPDSPGEVTLTQLLAQMSEFQKTAATWPYVLSGATPGFRDYPVAGTFHPSSFGQVEYNGDATMRATLSHAIAAAPDAIQLITWNDYIEGTMIEPTEEFGYQFLEAIQDIRRSKMQASFPWSSSALRFPLRIYQLRKRHSGAAKANASIDQAVSMLIRGDSRGAEDALQALESDAG